jgi:hypothetical protein
MLNLLTPNRAKGPSQGIPMTGIPKTLYSALAQRAELALERKLLTKGCIVFCGASGPAEIEARKLARKEHATFLVGPEEDLSTAWLAEHVDEIDVLMVDGDYLGDVEDTIDFCLQVRRAAPSLPIILISSEMRGDDFTCERMQACDVSVKSGFSETRLGAAIRAAYENNAYFLASRS